MSALDAALFRSSTPAARDVTLADGSVHKLHFLDLSAERWAEYHEALSSENAEVAKNATYQLLADCVCTPEGELAMSLSEAQMLKAPVVTAMRRAAFDANGLTRKEKNA